MEILDGNSNEDSELEAVGKKSFQYRFSRNSEALSFVLIASEKLESILQTIKTETETRKQTRKKLNTKIKKKGRKKEKEKNRNAAMHISN